MDIDYLISFTTSGITYMPFRLHVSDILNSKMYNYMYMYVCKTAKYNSYFQSVIFILNL